MGTACEASKTKPPYVFTDVIVDRLWVPFSPCGHRAPVFPSIASGYAIPVWPPIPALPVTLRIASPCQLPASRPAPPVHPRKRGRYPQNSSRKAKIQNYRNSNVYRAVFFGGRDYTGSVKRSPSPHPEIGIFIWRHQPREYVFFNLQHARKRACLTCISASHATEVDAS